MIILEPPIWEVFLFPPFLQQTPGDGSEISFFLMYLNLIKCDIGLSYCLKI